MEESEAMIRMSALSQPMRLDAFRRLVQALPGGMASGELADAIGASPSAMSGHLGVLSRAGLVHAERVGRTIVYRARPDAVQALAAFLAEASGPTRHGTRG